MKKSAILLLAGAGLGLVATPACAQLAPLVQAAGLGARLGVGAAVSAHQQKATAFVGPATYQAHTFPQKRTPARKLPRPDKGGTEIAAIEQLLAARYAALQADSTALLLGPELEKEFARLRTNLEAFNTFWNPDPYSAEMAFYRQHDDRQRRPVPPAGRR